MNSIINYEHEILTVTFSSCMATNILLISFIHSFSRCDILEIGLESFEEAEATASAA